jgi:hypothetical protein
VITRVTEVRGDRVRADIAPRESFRHMHRSADHITAGRQTQLGAQRLDGAQCPHGAWGMLATQLERHAPEK